MNCECVAFCELSAPLVGRALLRRRTGDRPPEVLTGLGRSPRSGRGGGWWRWGGTRTTAARWGARDGQHPPLARALGSRRLGDERPAVVAFGLRQVEFRLPADA